MTDSPPDVEVAAKVSAERLRFQCKPEVRVSAYADSPAVAESVSEREGLPDDVKPDVTYDKVAVRWRLAARLEDPELS